MNQALRTVMSYLPVCIVNSIEGLPKNQQERISELRLRLARPSSVTIENKNVLLIDAKTGSSICLKTSEVNACFQKICDHSIYKYESEIRSGYITVFGGCRAGFCGTRTDNGLIKDISSINFRLARQVDAAAKEIYPMLFTDGQICSTLIVGSPCTGKTTLLSDIAFRLSKDQYRVSIVDERCELAAMYGGIPQKAIGSLCDVLDNYPKGEGMMIALRCLSPQAIICDEIGTESDVKAMLQAMNAGVPIIASTHADSINALIGRPQIKHLLEYGGIEKIILLQGANQPGKVRKIISVKDLYENHCNHADEHRLHQSIRSLY